MDKADLQRALASPRTRKYGVRFLIALVAIGVLGFLVLPPIVKAVLVNQLSAALHRPVAIESLRMNPYALSLTVEGFAVKERAGEETFLGFDRLYLNVESSSILRGGPVLNEVQLVNPRVRLVRGKDRRYNFSDLLDEFMAKPASDEPPPRFSVNNIQLSGGSVEFIDELVDEKHMVSDIALTLPFVSSMAYATDTFVEPAFSAKVNGAPLDLSGRSKPFADSLESELALDLADLQLSKYLDYLPFDLPIKMSGALDTDLKLVFRQEKDKPAALTVSGMAVVKNFDVKEASGSPLAAFKKLEIALGSADLLHRRFTVEHVRLESPDVSASASKDGTLNWLDLLERVQSSGSQAAQPAANPRSPGAPQASPVEWSVGEVRVTDGVLRWLDESNGVPFKASVEAIDVAVKKLSSKGAAPATFELGLRAAAAESLAVESLAVKEGQIDIAKREVVVGDLLVRGVRGGAKRDAKGSIAWINTPNLRAKSASSIPAPATPPEGEASPWKVKVAHAAGESIDLRFDDAGVSPATAQTVSGLGFEVQNFSVGSTEPARVSLHFKLNGKGEVAAEGNLTPAPLNADMKVDVKTLELLPLQPYFSEKLNVAVTSGHLSMNGDAKFGLPEKAKGAETSAGMTGGFSGQVTLGDFRAVDKLNEAEFLRWKSFYFGKIEAKLNPDSLVVGDVALSDFFARVIVSPEGKLNLMQIVRKPGDGPNSAPVATAEKTEPVPEKKTSDGKAAAPLAQAEAPASPLPPVRIDKITLQGGTIRFTDNFVKPNYSANLRQIGGRVTGLSSAPGSVASLELRGSYDNVAPLNITAKINPLSAKPYLDLQADIKGVELTSLSSYSGKYAGYAIDKGKLSLFVNYKIENDQLVAENRVFLDQLTFGDPVDSPDAVKLPVTLAVALLKNRAGEIDLNLPISGSLNDPQFSIGGLVVKVIMNLLVKAVTSPFALIGSMFGGGEELSNIDFDFGYAAISPAAEKRLEQLAKALVDRPALKLEIEARVDPDRDREGLKKARLERKVRALKREDLVKAAGDKAVPERVEVSEQEYPALLERVYRAESFPKPRNMIGLVKTLPVEEMEKLIFANSVVDDDDLRSLGDRRARGVRDWLVAREIPADRIFLKPVELKAPESKSDSDEKTKTSRVDFSLR